MTTDSEQCGIEAGLMATEDGREFLRVYRARVGQDMVSRLQGTIDALKLDAGIAGDQGAPLTSSPNGELLELFRKIIDKINEARSELQSIASMARERDTSDINAVEDELAAIVTDTERATTEIMDSTDAIEDLLRGAAGKLLPEEVRRDILRKCGDITLSCSFQDVTGQRVRKVVEVIQHIDQHISIIEHNLGTPMREGEDSDMERSRNEQKRAGLLNGPGLPGKTVGQSDIDELFPD